MISGFVLDAVSAAAAAPRVCCVSAAVSVSHKGLKTSTRRVELQVHRL